MGSLFRPKYPPAGMSYKDAREAGLLRQSEVWWVKYRANGQTRKESSESTKESDAKKLLRQREGAVVEGRVVIPRASKVTVHDLADAMVAEYQANQRRSSRRLKFSLQHLLPVLGDRRAVHVTAADVDKDKAQRLAAGAAHATINRELAALKRMFSLAVRGERIPRAPYVAMLQEANVRTGFFEREQFEAIRHRLADYLQPIVTFAYVTGWRVPSEVLTLQWRQIDFDAGTVRLDPGTTKNGEGRTFVMTPELRACLEGQRAFTEKFQREHDKIVPWVFHHDGEPIKCFRGAWRRACAYVGLHGRIPHDFRRTAVRNLERAGVSRSVAMKMTGHKTEAVYRRYAIVSEQDLREAATKLAVVDQGRVGQVPRVGQVLGQVRGSSR
jgi:integrase